MSEDADAGAGKEITETLGVITLRLDQKLLALEMADANLVRFALAHDLRPAANPACFHSAPGRDPLIYELIWNLLDQISIQQKDAGLRDYLRIQRHGSKGISIEGRIPGRLAG